MGQKIGILGGTFNPIHNGHIKLAQTAYEQIGLDKVILMPSGKSYMKRDLFVLPGEERLKLIDMSIKGIPYFESSDIEITRKGNTYTFETLEFLKANNPENEYYFILGADCLFSMENWVKPERIFSACTIIAAVRNGKNKTDLERQAGRLKDLFQANIVLLDFNEINISSSEIRNRLKNNVSVEGLVPENIINYLTEKRFFCE